MAFRWCSIWPPSPVHDGERLFVMLRRGEDEVVQALAPGDGRLLWEHAYSAPAPAAPDLDTSYGNGPNATPLVAGGRVLTLGFTGKLHALDAASGKVLWARDLREELGADLPYFGLAASPAAHDGAAIVVADGVYAFELASGETRWVNRELEGSYASPVIRERDGTAQVLIGGAGEVVALDAADGTLLWRHEHANDQRTILCTPVLGDDDVLFVSAYFKGSVGLQIAPDGRSARPLWTNGVQFSHRNALRLGDRVVGFHNATLTAVDVATGEIAWRERGLKPGNLVRAGAGLLLLDERGALHRLRVRDDGVDVLQSAPLLEGRSWTAPAPVGAHLFARNLDEIVAVDLVRSADAAVARRPSLRERFDPAAVPAPARKAFLQAKRALADAAYRGDVDALENARAAFATWTDDPHLAAPAAYYRGFASWQQALTLGRGPQALAYLDRAVEDLQAALARDERFADAHALLGTAYPLYWTLAPRRAAVIGVLGDDHLQRAGELAPDDLRLALFEALDLFHSPPEYGGDRARGIEELRRAAGAFAGAPAEGSGLLPDWGAAMGWAWYASSLAEEGRDAEAREAARRALALRPDFAWARTLIPDEAEP